MIDIDLTDIAHGGACVGRAPDGRVVFARFGLPGERVRVEVTGERSSLVRGDVVEVLSGPSEHRVQTAWPEAGPLGVGGAELGHVAFDFQARWKTHVLRATLARVGGAGLAAHLADRGVDCRVRPMDGDARTGGWATRTRVEFVVGEDGTPSMHREGTHDLLPVSGFPLAVADVGDLDLFGAWRRAWRPGQRVRAVAPSGSDPVIAVGQTCWWAPGFRADRYVREDVVVDGRLYPYRVRASGFWQVHREAGAVLMDRVVRAALSEAPTAAGTRADDLPLDPGALAGTRVVELYAGAGLFTLPLAALTGTVRSLEGEERAVRDARRTLHAREGARLLTGRVTAAGVAELGRFTSGAPGADAVVLDPPRQGAGREVVEAVAALGAPRVVMAACDPAAGARDLGLFMRTGYRIAAMSALDMFPHTHHFETVCVLERE